MTEGISQQPKSAKGPVQQDPEMQLAELSAAEIREKGLEIMHQGLFEFVYDPKVISKELADHLLVGYAGKELQSAVKELKRRYGIMAEGMMKEVENESGVTDADSEEEKQKKIEAVAWRRITKDSRTSLVHDLVGGGTGRIPVNIPESLLYGTWTVEEAETQREIDAPYEFYESPVSGLDAVVNVPVLRENAASLLKLEFKLGSIEPDTKQINPEIRATYKKEFYNQAADPAKEYIIGTEETGAEIIVTYSNLEVVPKPIPLCKDSLLEIREPLRHIVRDLAYKFGYTIHPQWLCIKEKVLNQPKDYSYSRPIRFMWELWADPLAVHPTDGGGRIEDGPPKKLG